MLLIQLPHPINLHTKSALQAIIKTILGHLHKTQESQEYFTHISMLLEMMCHTPLLSLLPWLPLVY